MLIKKIIILFAIISSFTDVYPQFITPSVISAGGNSSNSENIYYSYTIGQIANPSLTGSNILTQGFQQPIIINEKSELNFEKNEIQFNYFPNPVKDILNINITSKNEISDIQIEIYNILGKIVIDKKIQNIEGRFMKISIPVEELSSGQYLIYFRINNILSKSFKIVKTQ